MKADLIADLRDAVAIAKDRAHHAGSTERIARWVAVEKEIDKYVAERNASVAVSVSFPANVTLSPCLVQTVSSRMCMLGTKGCVLVHPADGVTVCVNDTPPGNVTK